MVLKSDETITSADYHTGGEPFRIVDIGPMEGTTVLDRRSWAEENLDDVRKFLINEPRGHADMYGGFVVPADDGNGDLGVVFFHKDGFSTACGHGTIALVTWAIDSGLIEPKDEVVTVIVDVPSGRLVTEAKVHDQKVESVCFQNVPSFVSATNISLQTSVGQVNADISFGGAFYASVNAGKLGLSPTASNIDALISLGREIKDQLKNNQSAVHPDDDRLSGVYGTIFYEEIGANPLHQRNMTVFADGQVDRSPCGSGTSARLALLHKAGRVSVGESFYNEGVAKEKFIGKITSHSGNTVTTTIQGSAYHYATSTFVLDSRDSLGNGFQLR